jgi:hypothetical protein
MLRFAHPAHCALRDENMPVRPNPSDIAAVAFLRSIVSELIRLKKLEQL